ncbi:uncharacterized protein LOC113230387 [Hyposmocoma kahamanoa]|uniref:uncharacterized protein LOC113230387 n=1 Tax=Hyposmocoma kahamanoa TaxID=1477025 RepID=UPI000E6D7D93|nr:uncharacterized protein LOC113230387 [Hyposmocoma kahamanoa]
MAKVVVFLFIMICGVMCKPFENENAFAPATDVDAHRLHKRFIDLSQTFGSFPSPGLTKIRTKRSYEEDCEKLQLCKLHARANRNFISAFELYFVNKENARLWDHKQRSISNCYKRFGRCYRR